MLKDAIATDVSSLHGYPLLPFFFTSNNYSSSSSFFISSLMKVVTNVMLQFKGYASQLLLITRDVTLLYHCLQVLSLSTFSSQKN
jgi:hypothetical protein